MSAPLEVAVVGATGFLGGEVLRLLANHPQVRVAYLAGASSAGRRFGELRPGFGQSGLGALMVEPADAEAIAERCQLAFLALPHGESAALTRELLPRGTKVIDLGSDFRLRDPADYPRYYRREHPCPELLSEAFYGLPELTGAPPAGCRLVANPGCFATALAIALAPLAPFLESAARVAISGVTGSSGSGVGLSPRVHHSLRTSNLAAYKVLEHQHLGEVRQLLAGRRGDGRAPALDFVPHSGPLVRGIHLTLMFRRDELTVDVAETLEAAYADAPLVDVSRGQAAQLASVLGSCRVALGVFEGDGALVVTAAIDNLLKGGSGQAVQNLNLLCGFEPNLGIPVHGCWP